MRVWSARLPSEVKTESELYVGTQCVSATVCVHIHTHTHIRESLNVLGTLEVEVQYEGQRAHLPLFVLKGDGPSLFGRNWLESVRLD